MVDLFTNANWMTFCDRIQGHDDEVTEEFLMSLRPKSKTLATVNFKGLTLKLTPQLISRVTDLPLGVPWSKGERASGQKAKKEFFLPEEQFSEDKNGVWRASLNPFWSKVNLQIMKYITCEGRFSIVYDYHFRLLTELRRKMDLPTEQKLSIPYFLLQSLIECGTKLKERTPDQLAHHGLIKLLVEDALHIYIVPLSWEIFRNMTKDDDIRILAEELTSSSSEEREHLEAEEKAKGKETQDKPPQKEQEEKQEKGQAAEPKTMGGIKAQTPREKQLQIRAERTEKVQASEGTPKETIAKLEEKAPPAKQAKTVKTVSTGS